MSALVATLLSVLGVGGLCVAIETWIRRREHRAAEGERARLAAESARIHHEQISERVRARAQIDAEAAGKRAQIDAEAATHREQAKADIDAAEAALEARTREPWPR